VERGGTRPPGDRGADRIATDLAARPAVDPMALATALTWLGERRYYLAALDVAPFDNQDVLIDTVTHIWMTTLYSDPRGGQA